MAEGPYSYTSDVRVVVAVQMSASAPIYELKSPPMPPKDGEAELAAIHESRGQDELKRAWVYVPTGTLVAAYLEQGK